MLQGPVGSPYPGKYTCFAMAALFATATWRALRSAVRTLREQRRNAAEGTLFRPDAKKDVGAAICVSLVGAFLLVMMLVVIYKAWPN